MPLIGADQMRSSIADVIGRDSVYITAKDEVRHFDPNSDVWIYAGKLLFGFASSGGVWLWNTIKKKGAETGEKAVGDAMNAALDKVKTAVSHKPKKDAGSDAKVVLQEQAQQLDIASQALRELGSVAEPKEIESFLAGGEAAVTKQLIEDNFPEAKARRIAAAVALQVEMRLKGTQTA
jgi:hypothetical protein